MEPHQWRKIFDMGPCHVAGGMAYFKGCLDISHQINRGRKRVQGRIWFHKFRLNLLSISCVLAHDACFPLCIDEVKISLRCFMRIKKTCPFCKQTINLRLKVYLHMWLYTFASSWHDVRCPHCKEWSVYIPRWTYFSGGVWAFLCTFLFVYGANTDREILMILSPVLMILGLLIIKIVQIYVCKLGDWL